MVGCTVQLTAFPLNATSASGRKHAAADQKGMSTDGVLPPFWTHAVFVGNEMDTDI
jgi:hypothetical protein